MSSYSEVLTFEPTAYMRVDHTIRQVVRPRRQGDIPALVKWFPLSGEHLLSSDAWQDAANRLQKRTKELSCSQN